ncbi:MAG TPA: cbb3-type cytochrome c oxidase subunit I [Anaeromyxobacteraceae bacterium]|nr:cbb3-type cytochrome c oxidase subunit I [Anaeromyxobacteraceae bacterium]
MTGPAGSSEEASYLSQDHGRGIAGWIFSTDHKRVGVLYLVSLLSFFLVAMTIGVFMRVEQLTMGRTIMGPVTYNALFTLHGVIMVFLFVIPGLGSTFGNFMLPLMIGARDVAFPRLNLLSWWFYVIGAAIVIASLFTGGGPPDTGWTFYVPYSLRTTTNIPVAVFGAFVIGFSSILTGLNFITTIHRLRAPGMRFGNMPLFAWSLYATSWVQLLATPVLGITLLLVILERVLGVPIFDPAKGGDPLLYQHLFWLYSHPAVYVMILPAMGAVTEIIPTFARRTVFGYRFIAFSSMAIAGVGSLVWAHHMFTSGLSDQAAMVFSLLTFLVAVPSAIKVFNWLSTLYKGSIQLSAALLFTLGFVFLFGIGGLTGLMQGALAVNVQVHDTYFVVGHFHYVIFGGTGFAFFAALHYWFPKMFGRMVDERRAMLTWIPIFVGFNLFYFSMLVIGAQGMPRRYFDHLPQFHTGHLLASGGAFLMVAGVLAMFHNLGRALLRGAPAPANPWGGVTLEWSTSSPPPAEDFAVIPEIPAKPYAFPREVAR